MLTEEIILYAVGVVFGFLLAIACMAGLTGRWSQQFADLWQLARMCASNERDLDGEKELAMRITKKN